jgi:putative ABC transport system ATP-binding protein
MIISLLHKIIIMNHFCIRTQQLEKKYKLGTFGNSIIKNVNISISSGEFPVIMGNSGSGKSTLLYLLSGLDTPSSGEIWIDNKPVHQLLQKDLALMRRETIGFVFQDNNLIPNLSILENILVAGYLVAGNRKSIIHRAKDLLEELGILSLADRYPSQVSGGELQRAAIARAMINKPTVLLADEPTGSLNSEAAEKVLDCFTALNKNGQTIIMVTHDLKSACIGNRILFLKDGSIAGDHSFLVEKNNQEAEDELYGWLKRMGW